LSRVRSGKFEVSDAVPLQKILSLSTTELEQQVIPFLKLARERE